MFLTRHLSHGGDSAHIIELVTFAGCSFENRAYTLTDLSELVVSNLESTLTFKELAACSLLLLLLLPASHTPWKTR